MFMMGGALGVLYAMLLEFRRGEIASAPPDRGVGTGAGCRESAGGGSMLLPSTCQRESSNGGQEGLRFVRGPYITHFLILPSMVHLWSTA